MYKKASSLLHTGYQYCVKCGKYCYDEYNSMDYFGVNYFELDDNGNIIWKEVECGNFIDEVYENATYDEGLEEEEYSDCYAVEECDSCYEERTHEVNQYMVVNHGLSAFDREVTDLSDIDSKLSHMLGEPEIEYCGCTTRHCGPVGITAQAMVSHHFDHDCWSTYDGGVRVYGRENVHSDHDELWFSRIKRIDCLWVKTWYWSKLDSADKMFLQEMAKDYGTVLKLIHAET